MAEEPPLSDAELAVRAQAGDRHAFELLVQRHKTPLFRLIRRYTGNDDDSYDILQDTFISAWIAIRRYDPRRPFAIWIRAIALNKCRDYGRRYAVRRRILRFIAAQGTELAEPAPDAEWEAAEAIRLQRLDRAIADLPAFYKEPLLLTMVSGLSQQETAEQLKTTAKAIEMRIRRARKRLANALSDVKGQI